MDQRPTAPFQFPEGFGPNPGSLVNPDPVESRASPECHRVTIQRIDRRAEQRPMRKGADDPIAAEIVRVDIERGQAVPHVFKRAHSLERRSAMPHCPDVKDSHLRLSSISGYPADASPPANSSTRRGGLDRRPWRKATAQQFPFAHT